MSQSLIRSPAETLKPLHALPKKKREFLKHYVRIGDVREAYMKAGYKVASKTNAVRSYGLLKELSPYLQEAFTKYVEGVEMGILSVKVIKELATGAESEQVRLNAAKELKTLAIKDEPQETIVTHVHQQLSNAQLDERLKELQDELFDKAPKLSVVSTQ